MNAGLKKGGGREAPVEKEIANFYVLHSVTLPYDVEIS